MNDVATAIVNPRAENLSQDNVAMLSDALSASRYEWLAHGVAIDFILEEPSTDFEAVWELAQQHQIDLVQHCHDGRRKKVLLADMDSTIIQQECIDELAAEAGIGQHVADITARAMNGELEFDAALRERVALLEGLPSEIIQKVINERITLMPGAKTLLNVMKANGAYCALVSGGFSDFTTAIATRLGFDENRANTLLHRDGKLQGRVAMPILGKQAKVDALIEITNARGLSAQDVIAVGDGANDLGMLTRAGTGVALHAKPAVGAACNTRLNFADLTGLLYIQGYTQAEIQDSDRLDE